MTHNASLRRPDSGTPTRYGISGVVSPRGCPEANCVLLGIQGPGVAEVGYWVRREARGRGYATRATRLVSESGIHELALSRIQLHAFPENVASQRVAEKAGFTREGILRSYREVRGGSSRPRRVLPARQRHRVARMGEFGNDARAADR